MNIKYAWTLNHCYIKWRNFRICPFKSSKIYTQILDMHTETDNPPVTPRTYTDLRNTVTTLAGCCWRQQQPKHIKAPWWTNYINEQAKVVTTILRIRKQKGYVKILGRVSNEEMYSSTHYVCEASSEWERLTLRI